MPQSFDRLAEQLKDRYVVEREIGAGGMATVYLAQDTRHRRPVALKVIRPEVAGVAGIDRFLKEIELAARLQHPHILAVFDSGAIDDEAERVPYFVMPFIEGETLRGRLVRENRLPVADAVRIAGEVADALAYAHAHGVVHRDIKPENILLSGSHAIVADFGVAKALGSGAGAAAPAGGATRLTVAGFTVGTPHYMSPEQATAQDNVDARSDQYSLAAVLYEMLAGTPPFDGKTPQSVIAKSLSAARPRPSRGRPEVPGALDRVVTRAMALDPAERYPDMPAFGLALRAAAGERGSPGRRAGLLAATAIGVGVAAFAGVKLANRSPARAVDSAAETIAVLPFSASGPGTEVLGEGMVDLLSTNLQGVGGIRMVDPRSVLKHYSRAGSGGAGGVDRAIEVGRKVDAGSVIMGSAVSTGSRVRLAADLYSIAGERIGRAQVDGPSDSVLGLVDRLSVALLRDVWRSREPLPSIRVATLTTDSIEALRSYLQGERYYRRLLFDSALTAYTHAVEVDSTFALAHFRRGLMFGWIPGGYGSDSSMAATAAAMRFAGRLPLRERRLLDAYHSFELGKPRAIDSLRAYVADYPDDLEGWFTYGEALYHLRDFRPTSPDTIMAAFDRVLQADSTLTPALIHPIELSLLYRDTVKLSRYQPLWERFAPEPDKGALEVARKLETGGQPGDSAMGAIMRGEVGVGMVLFGIGSQWRREDATSDTVLQAWASTMRRMARVPGRFGRIVQVRSVVDRAYSLVGLGRLQEALKLVDTVSRVAPGAENGVLGLPILLGLAPPGWDGGRLQNAVRAMPPGRLREYVRAMQALTHDSIAEGRKHIAAGLAMPDSSPNASQFKGLLIAAGGWASLIEGDTTRGEQLRAGIDTAAGPSAADGTAFMRFQLALALSSKPDTRAAGIQWLRYAFDHQPSYFIPLSYLALGRAYETAGSRDSAAHAYGRFIELWDKADPPLQGRVQEAREALARLTGEPRR